VAFALTLPNNANKLFEKSIPPEIDNFGLENLFAPKWPKYMEIWDVFTILIH